MIEEAKKLLAGTREFSISTKIPKDWLIREERIWDVKLGQESIKNRLNKTISAALPGSYVVDGEMRVIFDYSDGSVKLQRNELFVFGRYKKHTAGLSQSRWICQKCNGKGCKECNGKGRHYESVEERIGEPMRKAADGEAYVMHASGREDVDATNSAGRAFVMEVKNPKKRELDLEKLEKDIAGTGEVSVEGLRTISRRQVELVTESHFDKTYEAEVGFGRELSSSDIKKIKEIEGKTLLQRTPKRVAHRRADMVRHRKVKRLDVKNVKERNATIIVKAEAGTYIKELISGDDGRTSPSIAAVIGTGAVCTKLDVKEIDDSFLDFVI